MYKLQYVLPRAAHTQSHKATDHDTENSRDETRQRRPDRNRTTHKLLGDYHLPLRARARRDCQVDSEKERCKHARDNPGPHLYPKSCQKNVLKIHLGKPPPVGQESDKTGEEKITATKTRSVVRSRSPDGLIYLIEMNYSPHAALSCLKL